MRLGIQMNVQPLVVEQVRKQEVESPEEVVVNFEQTRNESRKRHDSIARHSLLSHTSNMNVLLVLSALGLASVCHVSLASNSTQSDTLSCRQDKCRSKSPTRSSST